MSAERKPIDGLPPRGDLVLRLPAKRAEATMALKAHVQRCIAQGMSTTEIARRTLVVRTGCSERWVRMLAAGTPKG